MSFETNADEWAAAQSRALTFQRKAPETNPWITVADAHQPYTMFWLDAHQFHPWGYNVRQLYATPGWSPP
jgi:hypothetical protein